MGPITSTVFPSLLTQAPLTAYVWVGVWVRACVRARPFARYPCAIRARYALCRTASLFLAHHHCFDVVNFTFPKFTHTGAPHCLCVCGCVDACVRAGPSALVLCLGRALGRYVIIICQAGQPVSSLLIITVLTTSRCQFHFSQVYSHRLPSLLMCVCVCVCVRLRARACARAMHYALCVCAISARTCVCVCARAMRIGISSDLLKSD
jgi:hypothetical protein